MVARLAAGFFAAAWRPEALADDVLAGFAPVADLTAWLTDLAALDAAASASSSHLPDSTRWAASATASAISEVSLPALVIIVLAAALALSAASIPASRIALRAFGLAAMAAAAAVSPAASISRLIATLATFSIVVCLDELLAGRLVAGRLAAVERAAGLRVVVERVVDLAIEDLLLSAAAKTVQRRNGSPTRAIESIAFRTRPKKKGPSHDRDGPSLHGQRLEGSSPEDL